MPSLLDDPEAYAFAAQVAEDERKKLGLQSLLGGIGGLLETPVSYIKERATALATDPIGDMKRTMQGTIDGRNARNQLQQIAYGDPTNPLRVTDQAAADQLAQDYLDMASTIMPMGMVAPKSGLLSAVPTSDVADTLIYHGTTPSAAKAIEKSGFDVSKSADGTIWFTSNPNIGEVAASGKGAVVNRKLNESNLKLAGWDEIDKYSVDQLLNMGYDGVKMPDGNQTMYQIFNPEKLKR